MKHFFVDKDLNFNLLDSSKFLREMLSEKAQVGETQVAQAATEGENAGTSPLSINPDAPQSQNFVHFVNKQQFYIYIFLKKISLIGSNAHFEQPFDFNSTS